MMQKFSDNGEPIAEPGVLRNILSIVSTFVFVFFFPQKGRYVGDTAGYYVVSAVWLILFFLTQFFISKPRNERFSLKSFLASLGYLIIMLLVLYNVFNLMVSASGYVPESVSRFFPALLMIGAALALVGLGFHLVHKISKF